jgi:hypothetical protein
MVPVYLVLDFLRGVPPAMGGAVRGVSSRRGGGKRCLALLAEVRSPAPSSARPPVSCLFASKQLALAASEIVFYVVCDQTSHSVQQ